MPTFLAALDMDRSVRMALRMSAPPFPRSGSPLNSSQTLAVVLCFLGEVIDRCYLRCGLISSGHHSARLVLRLCAKPFYRRSVLKGVVTLIM